MARPRTPTKMLELRGAYKKNPQRRRDPEPMPEGEIGQPPARLSEIQQQAWHEIVDNCAPGVLTNMDRLTLELICMGLAEAWSGKGNSTDRDRVFRQLGKFGMNPSDRAGMEIKPPKKENVFAQFGR